MHFMCTMTGQGGIFVNQEMRFKITLPRYNIILNANVNLCFLQCFFFFNFDIIVLN